MIPYSEAWSATEPLRHQRLIVCDSLFRKACGYFCEQGTGKTKIILDRASALYQGGLIDGLLVAAPNGVHRNWVVEEIPKHLPGHLRTDAVAHSANQTKRQKELTESVMTARPGVFRIFTINIEALSTPGGVKLAERFLASGRMMMAVDESSTIKTPSARRTRNTLKLGRRAKMRAIATGTPVTQGPLDLYSQLEFLEPGYLGATYTAFKNRYAEWAERQLSSGHRFRELVRYRNLDELVAKVAAISYTVTKEQCLDLPPKVYERRPVVLSAEQHSAYRKLVASTLAEFPGNDRVSAPHMITRLMRLQQIVGGFIQYDDAAHPAPLANAKLDALMGLLDEMADSAKVIIWARFVPELQAITAALRARYGSDSVGCVWGEIKDSDRAAALLGFQEYPRQRFFVAQPHSAGMGYTLTAASYVIYFSNDFSLEARIQSEDRAHRIGQSKSVTYIDLVAEGTIDEKVLRALKDKRDVAHMFRSIRDILS